MWLFKVNSYDGQARCRTWYNVLLTTFGKVADLASGLCLLHDQTPHMPIRFKEDSVWVWDVCVQRLQHVLQSLIVNGGLGD